MFCPKCGKKMSDGLLFCSECGWKKNEEKGEALSSLNKKFPQFYNIVNNNLKIFLPLSYLLVIIITFLIVRQPKLTEGWHLIDYDNKMKTSSWVKFNNIDIYLDSKGDIAKNCIAYYENDAYYLGDDGALVRNAWVSYLSYDYYCDENGKILKNAWVLYDDDLYYVGIDGNIVRNQWIDNIYYVDNNGIMLKNTTTPDGYYVGADGKYNPNGNKVSFDSDLVYIYNEIKKTPGFSWGIHEHLNLPHSCYHDAKFDSNGRLWLAGGAGGARDGWGCYDILTTKNNYDSYYEEWGWMGDKYIHNGVNVREEVINNIRNQFNNLVDVYE